MTDNTQQAQGSGAGEAWRNYYQQGEPDGFFITTSASQDGERVFKAGYAAALSQPPEASEVEAVAYLKFWWDGQSPRTRVDLSEICEPWLDALKPTITPLYAHPPKPEACALRVALEWIVERDKTAASSAACEMANVARAALTKVGGE